MMTARIQDGKTTYTWNHAWAPPRAIVNYWWNFGPRGES